MKSPTLEVLVVERDPAVSVAISAALRRRGHRVSTASSGDEALEFPTPQVLVCDVRLGAFELVETLLRRGAHIHTVLLSDEPNLEDCRRALRLGAAEFLDKPFQLGDLVHAVETAEPVAALPAREAAWTFERRTLATVGNVERCVRELAAFMMRVGVGPTTRARVATATAEILDNAQRHAYGESLGHIDIEAALSGAELVVEVSDEGCGFDVLSNATEQNEAALDWGLARATALAEDVRVDSASDRGTRVSLRFTAFPAAFPTANTGENVIDLSELDFLSPEMSRRVLETLRHEDCGTEFDLSPALAVTVGRLLSGSTEHQSALRALWS